MDSNCIKMEHITKIFPPNNIALKNVSVKIETGKIHSIIGENGAGKSTLMKVLYGLEKANDGSIVINGENATINSPNDAVKYGIGMVHQEFMLIHDFTIMDNIILGIESTKNGLIDYSETKVKIKELLDQFNFEIDLDMKIRDVSIAGQQKVEIIKQLYRKTDVLILDEPTAVLTPQETQELFKLLNSLKESGKTILFISHKLDEVLEISDNITIMRKGEHIWTKPNVNLTKSDLANAMVGREVLFILDKEVVEPGNDVLSIKNLSYTNELNQKLLKDINLKVREGEIIGIAGVEGNGQYELVKILTENMDYDGSIEINGNDLKNKSVHERRTVFSYVPQDRKSVGSSLVETINDNAFMTHHYINEEFTNKFGLINFQKIKQFSKNILTKYQVNTNDNMQTIGSLSGGNQQKVILGREFELNHNFLIVDQPVRGLDVGSIEYIHNLILNKREEKTGILLISADLDELFNLSDNIAVLYKGEIAAILKTSETTKEEVGEYMLGAHAV